MGILVHNWLNSIRTNQNHSQHRLRGGDRLRLTLEESPISTRLIGAQEPPSNQSTSRSSPKSDKGKAKKAEFEDSNGNELAHSLDNDYGGLMCLSWEHQGPRKCSQRKVNNSIGPPKRKMCQPIRLHWLRGISLYIHDEGEDSPRAEKKFRSRGGSKRLTRWGKHSPRTRHGISSPLHPTKRQSAVGGYFRWSTMQMAPSISIRSGLWKRATQKHMV